jgi:hypothetical protein
MTSRHPTGKCQKRGVNAAKSRKKPHNKREQGCHLDEKKVL